MASVIYNTFKEKISTEINWEDNTTTTIRGMLVTSAYTPDIDTDLVASQVTNEVVGDGYTAGGGEITVRTITPDDANDTAIYDADDIVWGTATITARGVVIYKDTGTPSTSPLIAYIDFGADGSSTSANFTVQWSTAGIFTLG